LRSEPVFLIGRNTTPGPLAARLSKAPRDLPFARPPPWRSDFGNPHLGDFSKFNQANQEANNEVDLKL
jgi:hypothetical protein